MSSNGKKETGKPGEKKEKAEETKTEPKRKSGNPVAAKQPVRDDEREAAARAGAAAEAALEGAGVYEEHYSDEGFWKKLQRYAMRAGKPLVRKALLLYYTARDPDTPNWARALIYGALGYFILPLDMITDWLPITGFFDDLLVLTAVVGTVSTFLTPEAREKSEEKLTHWFD